MMTAVSPVHIDGRELGYVRLWRKIKDSAILRDPHLSQLWMWILIKAAWEPRVVQVRTGKGETLVHLMPGQFIFGRKSASDELGSPAETVRDRMVRMKRLGMIAIQPAAHYSVVTVVNWTLYQGVHADPATQTAGQSATQPPPNRHKEEVKEVEETYISAGAEPSLPGIKRDRGNVKNPQTAPGRKPRRKANEYPQAVQEVYQVYAKNIVNVPAKKADALRNIALRIRDGYTPEQLKGAVEGYWQERQDRSDSLPYHANNFFLGFLAAPESQRTEAAHV